MLKTKVVLKEEGVLLLFICTGFEYTAWPRIEDAGFVRFSADWERMCEASASKIKLVPLLNPSNKKVVGITGMTSWEKNTIRLRLPACVTKTGEIQFLAQESI